MRASCAPNFAIFAAEKRSCRARRVLPLARPTSEQAWSSFRITPVGIVWSMHAPGVLRSQMHSTLAIPAFGVCTQPVPSTQASSVHGSSSLQKAAPCGGQMNAGCVVVVVEEELVVVVELSGVLVDVVELVVGATVVVVLVVGATVVVLLVVVEVGA